MRILINYGSKLDGETFSITLETLSDISFADAERTALDLFIKARRVVDRQIEISQEIKKFSVVSQDEPTQDEEEITENGAFNGNGKIVVHEDAEPTEAQLRWIKNVSKRLGMLTYDTSHIKTRKQASDIITRLVNQLREKRKKG